MEKELHIRLSMYHKMNEVDTEESIEKKLVEVLEKSGFEWQVYEMEEQEV